MSPFNWIPQTAWFGTEQSLQVLIDATEMVRNSISVEGLGNTFRLSLDSGGKTLLSMHDDEEDEKSFLLEVQDSVGIISINGSMTNNDSWFNSWMGIVSYQEISRAIIDAANDESVESILMNFHSGGGPVDGVFELADLIKEVDSFIKPIESLSNGLMGSGAYLLGVTARKVNSTKMSTVGSIGVITIHKEYTKMLKEQGIQVNIIRTGKYKALVNPYEKLTEEALTELQEYSDKIYGKFISHVALNLGVGIEEVDNNMAQGREFLGEDAFRVGLVDNITSLDKLVIKLDEQNEAASSRAANSALGNPTIGDDDMAKKNVKLSAENQAKLATGIKLEDQQLESDPVDTDNENSKLESKKDDDNSDLKLDSGHDDSSSDDEGKEKNGDNNSSDPSLTDYLKTENKGLTEKLAEVTATSKAAEVELAILKTNHEGFEKIIRLSMDRLSIGMGNLSADHANLNGTALIEGFTALNSKFVSLYPVGRQSALEVKDETPNGASNVITEAQLNAAKV